MKSKIIEFFSTYKLAFLSGVFIGTTYIPFPPWASLFCFVPVWLFWLQNPMSAKRIWWSGWIVQFTLTIIGFNWVAHTLTEFGHLPWPVAILCLFGFASFASLHIPLGGMLWYFLVKHLKLGLLSRVLALPLCVAFAERIFPMIFDWHFGYTWYWVGAPWVQTGEIWGVRFLSVLTIFFNLAFLLFFVEAFKPKAKLAVASVLGLFVALNIIGWQLGKSAPKPDSTLNVMIVQANIGNLEKHIAFAGFRGFRERIISKYTKVTDEGLAEFGADNIDFAIWPETAFPDHILSGPSQSKYTYRLQQYLNKNNLALVTGGYGYNREKDQNSNSMFVFNKQGKLVAQPYMKTWLLAFGEYFPGSNWFPVLREWFPQVAGFERGHGPMIQQLNGLRMGPQICYEGLFDWFSRDSALLGAQVLVNVTNDSWYGTWQQPYQHLYMTLSRAIETRLPIIRSTNTGISTVALASGEVMEQSPLHVPWKGLYEIGYVKEPKPTIFTRFGIWFSDLFFALWGVLVVVYRKRS
ncbi:MAG: apolipoprotein N-acyltransferase [Bdellovibrionales bacterium]|nr:apolipoprotein N-acyltransferase [Bdellovibrionales bacterium]